MMKELINIQSELHAPKNAYNSFGKYKYRSCESILEALKPLLKKYECTLTLSDKIVERGTQVSIVHTNEKAKALNKELNAPVIVSRVYVEATANIKNSAGEEESVTAYAREDEAKKGMDESQITGTASSYARKYALNGLFAIDDTKDADTDEFQNGANNKAQQDAGEAEIEALGNEKIRDIDLKVLKEMLTDAEADIDKFMEAYKITDLKDMTTKDYADAVKKLQTKIDKKEK